MKLNNEHLESFMTKAEQDPEIMEVMRNIIRHCHQASDLGITLEEVAAVGSVGWQLGQDPELQAILEYMLSMSKMGLTTEH